MLAELLFFLLNPLFFLVFVAVIVVVCLWSQSPNLAIPQRALRAILAKCFLDSLGQLLASTSNEPYFFRVVSRTHTIYTVLSFLSLLWYA